MVRQLFFFSVFYALVRTLLRYFREKSGVPGTAAATPISITQGLSVRRLGHTHLLE